MVLGRGSQSCVRNGDKAAQRYQKSGGEVHRISLENVSQRQCGDFHGFVYAFHMYSSLSFNLALVLHFGSVQTARTSSGFRNILELLFQFPDMLRLKVTNQTNGGLPAL